MRFPRAGRSVPAEGAAEGRGAARVPDESEGKYRMLMEQASDGIHTYDWEGNFLDANSKLCELLGYERDELLRMNVRDLVPDADLAAFPIRFDELRAGKTVVSERRLRRKDGTLLAVEISGKMIGGRVLQAIIRDITERKRAEDQLRRSEEWLRAIFEAARDGIIVEDEERIAFANEAYTRLLGYDDPRELIGRHVSVILSAEDGERMLDYGRRRVRGETPPCVYEFRGRRRDGTLIDLEASVSISAVGGKSYITTAIRDIADRKRAGAELRRAHDELERRVAERTAELAAANEELRVEVAERTRAEEVRTELLRRLVSAQEDERRRISRELHDQLGQHLTAMMLTVESLKSAGRSASPTDDLFRQLEELGDTVAREVKTLAWELRPTALDDLGLQTALQHYVESWSERARVPLDFQCALPDERRLPPPVETALYRIIQEALTNVLKHARARRVSLVLGLRGDDAFAVVEDDGAGFSFESLSDDGATGRRLGLLGMRERVALVRGAVNVESAPGAGTTVFVRVPVS